LALSPVTDKPSFVVVIDVNLGFIENVTDPMGLFDMLIAGIVLLAAIILAVLLLVGTF
jgi:hypothetical protein